MRESDTLVQTGEPQSLRQPTLNVQQSAGSLRLRLQDASFHMKSNTFIAVRPFL